jgi:hypothetical protein
LYDGSEEAFAWRRRTAAWTTARRRLSTARRRLSLVRRLGGGFRLDEAYDGLDDGSEEAVAWLVLLSKDVEGELPSKQDISRKIMFYSESMNQ